MSPAARMAVRMALLLPLSAAIIFAPAGSFGFWQGWVFLGIFVGFSALFIAYFARHDPKLLERRMDWSEPRREQKIFKMLWVPLWLITMTLPGFDYRFRWSADRLGGMPLPLTVFGIAGTIASWLLVFHVMRFNSFASAIVQVETGQKVITDGPYALVRHPMYSGFVVMILTAPFAMGSYVALVPALLLIPLLVFRLTDEERMLRKDLAGYAEYCERVRYRLVPHVF